VSAQLLLPSTRAGCCSPALAAMPTAEQTQPYVGRRGAVCSSSWTCCFQYFASKTVAWPLVSAPALIHPVAAGHFGGPRRRRAQIFFCSARVRNSHELTVLARIWLTT
jgi:hypothetical protein